MLNFLIIGIIAGFFIGFFAPLNISIINEKLLDEYIAENTFEEGILLIRRYYGITAVKNKN